MANKITKKDNFSALRTLVENSEADFPTAKGTISNADMLAFIDHELDLLDRKNKGKEGEKKLTSRQEENEALKAEILDYMELGSRYTPDELLAGVPNQPADMSKNRLVACVSQLVKANAVEVIKEKGKTYYSLTD